jgi:hypothetical protein
VTKWHCKLWNDRKDIQNVIFQKLPEWAQREDLIGWVRGDEATNPETANELARLSAENHELRAALGSTQRQPFMGLSFDRLVHHLSEHKVSPQSLASASQADIRWKPQNSGVNNLLQVFTSIFEVLKAGSYVSPNGSVLDELCAFGLLERTANTVNLSNHGRRFRNELLDQGKI